LAFRGIGQAPDSPVTGTAAWLSSICAILSKDPWYGPILNDPFAIYFASAISPEAAALLAQYDDPTKRETLIAEREAELPGSFSVVCYRKPEMQAMALQALEDTAAAQLVILGVGCDSLALRLATEGVKPRVYEIDRPSVTEFRETVFGTIPLDTGHITEVAVDFDNQAFGDRLIAAGYDPSETTVFFAEGLLGYVTPDGVDDIFGFIKEGSAPGSRFVFSFTQNRRADADKRVKTFDALDTQGETPVFDLPWEQADAFVQARGFEMRRLLSAGEMRETYKTRHEGQLFILPFMHLADAET
jgi:methyltransferase (TIGR00027 family)